MATDLFNNISNDYVNPDLAPCAGQSDQAYFEFLPNKQVGIVSGNAELAAMNFSDISQPVSAWVQQTRILQSGEVVFIQGLTKGITTKIEYFPIDGSIIYFNDYDPFYMSADVSVSYYKNFKYYKSAIHVEASESLGQNIADVLNIALGNKGIGIFAGWDASKFTFSGSLAGYDFNIDALDVSRWNPTKPDPSSGVHELLIEDVSSQVPASKYPNTAMLGYMLKVAYPASATDESLLYVNVNHVPDTLTYYESADVSIFSTPDVYHDSSVYYQVHSQSVNVFDTSALWYMNTTSYFDASANPVDVSVFVTDASWHTSTYSVIDSSTIVQILDASASYDASTYYVQYTKKVDVGMNGDSTVDTMSAGDYLNYVDTNYQWEKVGVFRSWLTAEDPDNSNVENLITGFYVFNPQTFPVQIEYMLIL
jgi:hypothetical protein